MSEDKSGMKQKPEQLSRRKALSTMAKIGLVVVSFVAIICAAAIYMFSRPREKGYVSIDGRVTTEQQTPLSDVTLEIPDIGLSARTNSSGYFRFPKVLTGVHKIKVIPPQPEFLPYEVCARFEENASVTFPAIESANKVKGLAWLSLPDLEQTSKLNDKLNKLYSWLSQKDFKPMIAFELIPRNSPQGLFVAFRSPGQELAFLVHNPGLFFGSGHFLETYAVLPERQQIIYDDVPKPWDEEPRPRQEHLAHCFIEEEKEWVDLSYHVDERGCVLITEVPQVIELVRPKLICA